MSKHNTGFKSVVLGVVVALGLVITAALPAQASSTDPEVNDQGQCLATPSRTDVINWQVARCSYTDPRAKRKSEPTVE